MDFYIKDLIISSLIFLIIILVILYVREYAIEHFETKMKIMTIPRRLNLHGTESNISIIIKKDYTFKQIQAAINMCILQLPNSDEFGNDTNIRNACMYAIDSGKRIRPAIVLEIGRQSAVNQNKPIIDLTNMALAIEYIHCASIIIDDMEHFDDDDIRRNKPSLHKKYGPAAAQMTALVLLTSAFQNISRQCFDTNPLDLSITNFINFFICSRIQNAATGQLNELNMNKNPASTPTHDNIMNLIKQKTGGLFQIATVCGWLFCNSGDISDADSMKRVGVKIANILQIADDIVDIEKDKEIGQKYNFANHFGESAALRQITKDIKDIETLLRQRNLYSNNWDEMIREIIEPI